MAKRIKTGIVAIGLGLLLGLGTPILAKDTKEQPKTQTIQGQEEPQEEQGPAFAYPVVKTFLTYEAKTPVNDATTIKMGIDYALITMLGSIPMQGMDSIVLTGKKDKNTVKLEELGRYNAETQAYQVQKRNEINPLVKSLAEKILTEKAYKENSEPDALIYELFEALNAELRDV
jgi:hypothetical protein